MRMLQLNFTPFPKLETERLLLRRIELEDAQEILFLRSDQNIIRYLNKVPAKNLQEAKDFIKDIHEYIRDNESILWGIALKDSPAKIIGTICLWQFQKEHYRAEIGYVLHPEQWRKGIMKEAILKVIDYAFNTLQLHSLAGMIDPANAASAAILESTGFTREGYFKEDFYFKGKFYDTAVYSRLHRKI
jgi:ribosomal-protein-alanine N-acetyltransferase